MRRWRRDPKVATVSLSLLHSSIQFLFSPNVRSHWTTSTRRKSKSAMSTRNEGTARMNSDNRKMKEGIATATDPTLAAATDQVNLFNPHSTSPSTFRHSQVQQILNKASSNNRLSYMSLLTAIDQGDYSSVSVDIKNQIEDISRINAIHNEYLRQELEGLVGKTAKKLKEREVELQQKMAQYTELEGVMMHYRTEVGRLQKTVRYLEQQAAATWCSEMRKADEPTFKGLRLECRNCKREMATVMLWPCRHVCVCRRCEGGITACPVCFFFKTSSLEVCLSCS